MPRLRLSREKILAALFSVAAGQGVAQTDPAQILDVIRSGRFEVLANTLLTDIPTLQFAIGVVGQAEQACGFQSRLFGNEALAFNYGYFLPLYHLSRYDEHGAPSPVDDGFVALARHTRVLEFLAAGVAFQGLGREFVTDTVTLAGCSNPEFVALVENADAIVALGKPPHVSGSATPSTLLRVVHEPGERTAMCHYSDLGGSGRIIGQIHLVLDPVNQDVMANQIAFRTVAGEIGEVLFMRSDCSNNPDPDRPMHDLGPLNDPGALPDELPLPVDPATTFERRLGEPTSQEMARYYIEVIVATEGSSDSIPDEKRRADIVGEIENFEALEISSDEVTKRAKELQERDLGLSPEDYCFMGDNGARREAFFNQYGRAFRMDHMPHPLREAGYTDIVVPGAAYISTSGIGRGKILAFQGRSWRWDGTNCTQ